MITKKGLVTSILSFFFLLNSTIILASPNTDAVVATEYAYVPVAYGQQNYQFYLDKLGVPEIRLIRRSRDYGKIHWVEILDRNNRTLKVFNDNYSVSLLGGGRYKDQAMLLVSALRLECEKNCIKNYLFGSNIINPYVDTSIMGSVFATLVLKNSNFMSMNKNGLLVHDVKSGSVKTIHSSIELTAGAIGSNIEGHWQAIAVGKNGEIMVADENGWNMLNLNLSEHGDRQGVLSIYPQEQGKALIAIYRFINEYNKGLYLLDYDLEAQKIDQQGWLFNSEDQNIGFDPSVYFNKANNKVIVSAINSTINNSPVYFTVSPNRMAGLKPEVPLHVQESGFAKEKFGSLTIGRAISQVSWAPYSVVKKDNVRYGEVKYITADSLFTSDIIEARLGNISLAINFLQNQAKDLSDSEIDETVSNNTVNNLTKNASSYLYSTVDFHGLLNASSSLRLLLEHGKTNGVAEINILDKDKEYLDFTSKYNRFALLAIQERGRYQGVDYVNYSMPSAVGFSDNNDVIKFTSYDPDSEFSSIRFVIGNDALAYAKRYETNYSRWYGSGGLNLGIGWATLSDQVKVDAKRSAGKSRAAKLPTFLVLGGEYELGYVWQKRSKSLGGFGYSAAIGYKINGNYLYGTTISSNVAVSSLFLEFTRLDVFHGPFLKANIVF